MNKEDEIRESLEFCRDIYMYYEKEDDERFWYPYSVSKSDNESDKPEPISLAKQYTESKRIEEEEDAYEEEGKRNFYRHELLPVIMCILFAFLAAKLISTYVIQVTIVHGDSMESTVSNKDKLAVSKVNYCFVAPKRFDIIVFSKDKEENFIKRIIGLPGEKVEIRKGVIYINGKELVEEFGLEPISPESESLEIQLKKGEYFVLGDNRKVSLDSRYAAIGPVRRKEIVGKVLFRLYPVDKKHIIS